jgi:hypothetical protein
MCCWFDNKCEKRVVYTEDILELTSTLQLFTMKQHASKNVNNCLNTNIYSYLQTSGGQSSNLYLNVVNFFNSSVN